MFSLSFLRSSIFLHGLHHKPWLPPTFSSWWPDQLDKRECWALATCVFFASSVRAWKAVKVSGLKPKGRVSLAIAARLSLRFSKSAGMPFLGLFCEVRRGRSALQRFLADPYKKTSSAAEPSSPKGCWDLRFEVPSGKEPEPLQDQAHRGKL